MAVETAVRLQGRAIKALESVVNTLKAQVVELSAGLDALKVKEPVTNTNRGGKK